MSPSSRKRFISGLVLGPVIVFALLGGVWPTIALLALCAGTSVYEWQKIAGLLPHPKKMLYAGFVYLAVCFSALVVVRFGFEENGTYLLLGLIAAIWGSDIGAYMFGKAIGGPKLAPKVSPNKTWAGLVGASFWCGVFLLNMDIVATSLVHVVPNSVAEIFPNYPAVFIVGCVMGVVAQGGDLLVSIFKRKAGVKDTGSIIPGHGGILDRIDALLLASVFYLLALLVVMP